MKTFLTNGDTQLVARTVRLSNGEIDNLLCYSVRCSLVIFFVFSVLENDFPELEFSCSAAYNREEGKYKLESQLTAPFSPATLSNIELFVIRWDAFQKPTGGASQPTALVLGLFRTNIPVSSTNTFFNSNIIIISVKFNRQV